MISRKKILLVVPSQGYGGCEMHTLTLASWLRSNGYAPVLCFPVCSGTLPIVHHCQKNNFEYIDADIAFPPGATHNDSHIEQEIRLLSSVDFNDFDFWVVASPSPVSSVGVLKAAARSGLPGIVIFHLVAEGLVLSEKTQIDILGARRDNIRFICVSQFTHDMLCNALGVPLENNYIDYIENGVEKRSNLRKVDLQSFICENDADVVVTIGRLHPQKGCLDLIKAVPMVLDQNPNARFVFFGEGPLKESILELADELNVSHAVYLAGFTDDVSNVMASAKVVVFPTLYEGLSLTLLEAMHAGAAIVTTDASYQDRIITDGFSGGIAKRKNPKSLAEAILPPLMDDAVNDMYRSNALALSKHYSVERMLNEYKEVIAELLLKSEPLNPSEPEEEKWFLQFFPEKKLNCQFALERPVKGRQFLEEDQLFLQCRELLDDGKADSIISFSVGGREVSVVEFFEQSWPTLFVAEFFVFCAKKVCRSESNFVFALFDSLSSIVLKRYLSVNDKTSLHSLVLQLIDLENVLQIELRPFACRILGASIDETVKYSAIDSVASYVSKIANNETASSFAAMDSEKINRITADCFAEVSIHAQDWALISERVYKKLPMLFDYYKYRALHSALTSIDTDSESQKGKVVVFSSFFNYPTTNGSSRRILAMMRAYQRLGMQVFFCGIASQHNFKTKTQQAEELRDNLDICSHYILVSDEIWKKLNNPLEVSSVQYDAEVFRDVRTFCEIVEPDVMHVNYSSCSWVAMATFGMESHRVLDTHDLMSRRTDLQKEAKRLLGRKIPSKAQDVPVAVHDPERFSALRFGMQAEELLHMRQFDTVLMISNSEASMVVPQLPVDNVRVVSMNFPYIPFSLDKSTPFNIVYIGGNNLFNLLGGAALQNHIAPSLHAKIGRHVDFYFKVYGDVGTAMESSEYLKLMGRVENITSAYKGAHLAICPIPCGTGQNIKIVEALSHGVPVIAYTDLGRGANVVHGVNGLLANNFYEMEELLKELICSPERYTELLESTRRWAELNVGYEFFANDLKSALMTTGCPVELY